MNALIDETKITRNGVCVDWFEFTLKIQNPFGVSAFEYMVEFLRLPRTLSWIPGYGQNGYRSCMYFEKIFIFFDPGKPDMGIHCRMSGQGCRCFESYSEFKSWKNLFTAVVYFDDTADGLYDKGNSSISRLDIAYDDFEGLIDLEAIADAVRNPLDRVVSRWKTAFVLDGVNLNTGAVSKTINFGKQSSDKFFTIYDKLQERKSKDIMPDVEIWNRAELKLRNGSSFSFASQVADGKSMLELYFLVLNNLVRIVERSDSDSNRWRWKMAEHWERFACSILDGRICLYSPPEEKYNEFKLENYVIGSAGAAIYTYLKVFSIYDLLEKVQNKINDPDYRLNTKYVELLNSPQEGV